MQFWIMDAQTRYIAVADWRQRLNQAVVFSPATRFRDVMKNPKWPRLLLEIWPYSQPAGNGMSFSQFCYGLNGQQDDLFELVLRRLLPLPACEQTLDPNGRLDTFSADAA
jgi:hypothetical protein